MADINGTDAGEDLDGTSSNDVINGRGGNDKIQGGAGSDTLNGEDGDDRLYSHTRLYGPNEVNDPGWYPKQSADNLATQDTLSGGYGNDQFFAGFSDNIDGGAGNDTLSINFTGATAAVTADFRLLATQPSITVGGGVISSIENIAHIIGSSFGDTLALFQTQLNGDAVLNGMGGDDFLYVTTAAGMFGPSVSGGDGNDTIDARGAAQGGFYTGDAGNDTIYTDFGYRANASGGAGDDTLHTWGNADGGDGNDIIVMNRAIDVTGFPLALGGAGDDQISVAALTGGGSYPVFQMSGGAGADILRGGDSDDVIASGEFSGNQTAAFDNGTERDQLFGLGGNDHIFAGYGDDADGGDGIDLLEYSFAAATGGITLNTDALVSATPYVIGGGSIRNFEAFGPLQLTNLADTVTVGTAGTVMGLNMDTAGGNDTITVNGTQGYLNAGSGNDTIISNSLWVSLNGGDGVDTLDLRGYTRGIEIALASTFFDDSGLGPEGQSLSLIENVQATGLADSIRGGMADNELYGFGGNDSIQGLSGNDRMDGGEGNDVLDGGAGNDVMIGGAGTDLASYQSFTTSGTVGVSVNLQLTGAQNTGFGTDTLSGFENLAGSQANDYLTGDAGSNQIWGFNGVDTLDGAGGADFLHGGLGDDTYYVETQADLVFEDANGGLDTIRSTVSFYLYDNVEILILAAGTDNLFGVGNSGANSFYGNAGSNLLIGGDGNDFMSSAGGADSLFGQAGDDYLYGGFGIDYLVGGIGNDRLDGEEDADALYGEDGDDFLDGGSGFVTDILVGGAGNDVLDGDSRHNEYDLMDGGAGDDVYYVDTGDDLTFEAAGGGTDTVYADVSDVVNAGVYLYANVENLVLVGDTAFGVGNELANTLTGSDRSNWLLGGAGNDLLNGKEGGDVLFGEGGADTFVFELETGGDVIGDFLHGTDKIDISAFGFASFAALQATFIQNGDVGAINLGNGDLIVLHNVTMAQLSADDFVL